MTLSCKSGGCEQTKRYGFRREKILPKEEEGYKRSTRSSNKKEVIGKINSSAGARPWSGTCARMKVIESPKGTKDRYKKLRERKMAWNQILSKSPHVTVRFGIGREDCNALLDTGADWPLIDDSLLNAEERRELEQSGEHGLYGRGVSGESITILGEVWRTLTLGELGISEQRYHPR